MELEQNSLNPYNELLKLSPQERTELTDRIKKWNGTIRLFVHPSFMSLNHHPKALENFAGHEKIEDSVKKMLELPEDKTPPLVIMEEHSNLHRSENNFNSQSQQKAFFIETEDSDPDLYQNPNGFKQLTDFFASLGVKRIIVGGQVLWIDTQELQDAGNVNIPPHYGYDDQRPWLGGCTGKAIENLNDPRFTIEISNLSFPHKPSTMRNVMS